jgi:hypothetical protein
LFVHAKDLFVEANGGPLREGRIRQPPFGAAPLLVDEQKKHSDSYQQGKQNTDDERKQPDDDEA